MYRLRARAFSLPELMIALVIGLALLAAFLLVLQRCRAQFATNESLARLQDSGRHALSVLVPDIEHAGFFGFSHFPAARFLRNGLVLAEGDALRQPDSARATPAVTGLPAGSHDCGTNFAVDLDVSVQGANNSYAVGSDAADCAPTSSAGGARAGADTLTLRHASLAITRPRAGRLQLYSRRLAAHGLLDLFADGRSPGALGADAEVRDVEVRTYYIARDSVERAGWPALRVKALTESRGAAQFRDEEVLPGVEDLQVEFAVLDSSAADGGLRLTFVPPDFPGLRERRIVAVRLWLRIRADTTEPGFMDRRTLQYADASFTPTDAEAAQRRVLIERTVALRNESWP
jgi:type IV pilus assembly protein PilW